MHALAPMPQLDESVDIFLCYPGNLTVKIPPSVVRYRVLGKEFASGTMSYFPATKDVEFRYGADGIETESMPAAPSPDAELYPTLFRSADYGKQWFGSYEAAVDHLLTTLMRDLLGDGCEVTLVKQRDRTRVL